MLCCAKKLTLRVNYGLLAIPRINTFILRLHKSLPLVIST